MKRIVGYFTARGGGNEIGRSMYVLTFPENKIIFILDCGIKMRPQSQGKDNVLPPNLYGLDPNYTIYVFLSHGHNDHIGMTAKLKKLYPNAIFFCTEPTCKITEVMGNDAIRIRERNGLFLHFDRSDLQKLLDSVRIVRSSDWVDLRPGFRVRFEPSGHIRGAASILLQTPYGIFMYSGDINFYPTTTVKGAARKLPDEIRWLALDSTNGDITIPDPEIEYQKVIGAIRQTTRNGGHVLIPSFALGRGPDVGIRLGREFQNDDYLKIFMGGLIRSTTEACHCSHWESDIPFSGEGIGNYFHLRNENIDWIWPNPRQLAGATGKTPGIFVVPSGMLQGGLSLILLRVIAQNPKNLIIFPGFQAEETNGRKLFNLQEGNDFSIRYPDGTKKSIKVLAKTIKAGLSGHSGGDQNATWVENMIPRDGQSLDSAILVHGDKKGQSGLQQKLLALPNKPKEVLVGINNCPIPLYA